jgi:phosphoserine phosphatase RsbX
VPDVQRGDAAGHEWAVACELHPGEDSLCDAFVIHDDGDRLLVAVIDGLGHGRDANHASRSVAAAVRDAADRELVEIVAHCHRKAQRTRGAVMSLAAVTNSNIEWVGVGNVETALIRGDRDAARPVESMMLTGGVVGYQLPPLRPRTVPVAAGDLLVLATDGIPEARDHDGREYGADRLARQVASAGRSPAMVLRKVLHDVERHVGRGAQGDDITLLAVSVV